MLSCDKLDEFENPLMLAQNESLKRLWDNDDIYDEIYKEICNG